MPRRKSQEEYISQVRKVHGDKYDYSKVEYRGSDVKICVVCPIHGEFWPTAHNHLSGSGHGIRVLYYSNLGIPYPYYVIEDFSILLKAIKSKGIIKDRSKWTDPELPFSFD